jgi:hypothetical protein
VEEYEGAGATELTGRAGSLRRCRWLQNAGANFKVCSNAHRLKCSVKHVLDGVSSMGCAKALVGGLVTLVLGVRHKRSC